LEKVNYSQEEIEKNTFLILVMIMKVLEWEQVLGVGMAKLVYLLDKVEQIFEIEFIKIKEKTENFGFTYEIFL
jgi:hypothetical protein